MKQQNTDTTEFKKAKAALELLRAYQLIEKQETVPVAHVPISGETEVDETVMTERLELGQMNAFQLGLLIEQAKREVTETYHRNKRHHENLLKKAITDKSGINSNNLIVSVVN